MDSCNMENQGSIKPLVEREVLHKDSNQTGSAIVSPDFMRKGWSEVIQVERMAP